MVAVPVNVKFTFTSLEAGTSILAVTVVDSCSANSFLETVTPVKSGSSSLTMYRVASEVSVVAFTISPKVKIIGSRISTASSPNPSVEIVILAELPFAGITICLTSSTIIYSSFNTADKSSSVNVNGMVTSAPDTVDAVRVTVVDEFSSIVGEENSNTTSENSSLSVSSKVNGLAIPFVSKSSLYMALLAVLGETINDSASSNKSSSSPVKVNVPVVSPAAIFNCGANW